MRITNGMMQQSTLSQLQGNMQRLAEAQQQVSSGLRIQKVSDDPTAAAGSMRARTSIRALDKFRRSVQLASSRGSAEEEVLLQVTDLLSRVKVLGTGQASVTATTETRLHAKAEVDQIFRQMVDFANTRFEGGFLFGGLNGDTPPLNLDESEGVLSVDPVTTSGQHTVEVGEGRYLAINHNAAEVFQTTGVLSAVQELAQALQDDDAEAITASMTSLDSAFSGIQGLIGEMGARMNQLDLTRTSIDATEVSLRTFKSQLEEIDFERAATELVSRQTAIQAAMIATSRVIGLSLADYLR